MSKQRFLPKRLFLAIIVLLVAYVAFLVLQGRTSSSDVQVAMVTVPTSGHEINDKTIDNNQTEILPDGDKAKLDRMIFHMEQYGAKGAVSIRAIDEEGKPVKNAKVRLGFTQPDQNWRSGIVEGETDDAGFFDAERVSNWSCVWTVSKDGYHTSRGEILFTHKGSKRAFLDGRWTDSPIVVDVELKKASGVNLVHGKRYEDIVLLPTNSWIGFDFTTCDLVEPHGRGKLSHILFRSESDGVPPFCKGATPGYTNVLHVKVQKGGLEIATEFGESDSPFNSVAPSSFITNHLTFVRARTRKRVLEDNRLGEKDYIIFKTDISHAGSIETYYGIIRNLQFSPGQLRMEYFFNPVSGDLRLDADVSEGFDLP